MLNVTRVSSPPSVKCGECRGRGMIIDRFGDSVDCPSCGGSGQD